MYSGSKHQERGQEHQTGPLHHLICLFKLLLFLGNICQAAAGPTLPAHAIVPAPPQLDVPPNHENAYVTMFYVGTPRDYEFFVATRVMLRLLMTFKPQADVVAMVSSNTPADWMYTFAQDGVRVKVVQDLPNPYKDDNDFDLRFVHALNKLLVWGLTEYKRVVMLDADNIFLRNTDELFQCGKFCVVFINPCIFHTGLFVLEPNNETLTDMIQKTHTLPNLDGADQGFLIFYYPHVLEGPLFVPPADGKRLDGPYYRLPFGYQLDAGFYYLSGHWNIPCSKKSVITFPSVPFMKPWYWWSWPALPLGLFWHNHRRNLIGYAHETPIVLTQFIVYATLLVLSTFIRRKILASMTRSSLPRWICGSICGSNAATTTQSDSKAGPGAGAGASADRLMLAKALCWAFYNPWLAKGAALGGITLSFLVPAWLLPTTLHPLIAWPVYFTGVMSLLTCLLAAMPILPSAPVLGIWAIGLSGFAVLAAPIYKNTLVKGGVLCVCASAWGPLMLWALWGISSGIDSVLAAHLTDRMEREPLMARSRLSILQQLGMVKLS